MNHNILSKFKTVTLEDIADFGLLDRIESKYVIHSKDLNLLISELPDNLKILTINGNPVSLYKTEYFDTKNYTMYLDHHRGKLNRYKIRIRSYQNTHTAYLEIKHKNNKGSTLKARTDINFGSKHTINEDLIHFVNQNSPYEFNHLQHHITTKYNRITFVDQQNHIKLTADTQLTFEDVNSLKTYDNLCILEIKKLTPDQTYIEKLIMKLGYKKFSVSKYCLAVSILKNLKSNRFKSKINKLNKILSYDQ